VYNDAIKIITKPGEHFLDVITLDYGLKLDPRILHQRNVINSACREIGRTITPDCDSDADYPTDSDTDSDAISNDISGFNSKKN